MMDLGLGGKRLQSARVEYKLDLQMSEVFFLAIFSPLSFQLGDTSIVLSPEDDPDDAFAPIRELIGQSVRSADTDPAGVLRVIFEGGGCLTVQPDPDYEAWNVTGPNGALIVSTPGGELAVWSAQPDGTS